MDEYTPSGGGPANMPPFRPDPGLPGAESTGNVGDPSASNPPDSQRRASGSPAESADAEGAPDPPLRPVRRIRPNRAFEELADRLEDVAARIESVVEVQFGAEPAAGRAAGSAGAASEALLGAADYLRHSDVRSVADDLAQRVREKPLQSVLLSVGAGWILGKIVR